jgi:hypothetical protein
MLLICEPARRKTAAAAAANKRRPEQRGDTSPSAGRSEKEEGNSGA